MAPAYAVPKLLKQAGITLQEFDFEFDFYPSPWQMKMVHVFGTQWSHWGTTYVINKETFLEDTKYIKIIEK